MEDINRLLGEHIRAFFGSQSYRESVWPHIPKNREVAGLRIARISPGPKSPLYSYVTIGAWNARGGNGPRLEFILCAESANERQVELLTMAAWYHREYGLGLGHTFPIGESWLPNSRLEFFLVSKPYPFGPQFEICNTPQGEVRFLWLLPITSAERDYKIAKGLEALEQEFDSHGLKYWEHDRESVV